VGRFPLDRNDAFFGFSVNDSNPDQINRKKIFAVVK